jgi:hypothetical protein
MANNKARNTMKKHIELNQQDLDVAAYLKAQGISYNAEFVGTKKDQDWERDQFVVTFSNGKISESFEYGTGIGHRLGLIGTNYTLSGKQIESVKTLKETIGTDNTVIKLSNGDYVVKPTQASVLYCLLSDADLGSESFDDFCDNLGYNSDSIADFKTYQACMVTAKQIRKLFTGEQRQALRDMLDDY